MIKDQEGMILLVGDAAGTVIGIDGHIRIMDNVLDGIETAATEHYDVIGLVVKSVSGNLSSALRAFREVTKARIVLLAEIEEEVTVRKFVAGNGEKLADDYLVCPVDMQEFLDFMEDRNRKTESAGKLDPQITAKIRELEKLATEDELTGLKNRRYFYEFARQIIQQSRANGRRVSLLIFDIDDFKQYNDKYGHSAGDEILKEAALLIKRSCRSHDIVARIGGDEFAVVFWDDSDSDESQESERRRKRADHPKEPIFIAQRFRRELGNAELDMLGPGGKGVLSISGGLASFPRDGDSMQEVFDAADKALLEAKASGKNRIYIVGKPTGDIAEIRED